MQDREEVLIEVENLKKTYKVHDPRDGFWGGVLDVFSRKYKEIEAVNNINISIKSGEIIGYIGLNGAGKSTSLKMMTGIMRPTLGEVKVCGLNPYKNRKKISKSVGVVFGQKTHLWADLPVKDSFELVKAIYDISDEDFDEKIGWLKNEFELQTIWNQQVRRLSLGQKMICEIALSLIYNPRILFLDEPTLGLDLLVKRKVLELVSDLNKKYGTTIIITSHDLKDIEKTCSRVILIDKGKIVYDGSISEICQKYGEGDNAITFIFDEKITEEDIVEISNTYKCKIQNNELIIAYDNSISVKDIIDNVMKRFDKIVDMTIKKGDLEDVVKRVYGDRSKEVSFLK